MIGVILNMQIKYVLPLLIYTKRRDEHVVYIEYKLTFFNSVLFHQPFSLNTYHSLSYLTLPFFNGSSYNTTTPRLHLIIYYLSKINRILTT